MIDSEALRPVLNREHARFWDADGNRKWFIFTFNFPSQNHIHITKYLFSIRDKKYTNLEDNTVLARENVLFRLPSASEKRECLSSLMSSRVRLHTHTRKGIFYFPFLYTLFKVDWWLGGVLLLSHWDLSLFLATAYREVAWLDIHWTKKVTRIMVGHKCRDWCATLQLTLHHVTCCRVWFHSHFAIGCNSMHNCLITTKFMPI